MSDIERVVLVTGGTRGIGRAVARRLAAPDTALAVTYVNPESKGLRETVDELTPLCAHFEAQRWSVDDSRGAAEAIKDLNARFGRLDVLVNNAGLTKDNLAVRLTDENFSKVIAVNLNGAFYCSREAAKIMMRKRSGRIINLTSVVAFTGNAGQVSYSASKSALVGLTKSLALELAPRGVTLNAVAPGYIATDMTGVLSEDVRKNLLARIPLGQIGQPSDVAEAVAFLASAAAAYITGQTLHVNGGLYM
jgi:3-oxoacyl-[acyl-carrier protein] reductase